MNKKDLITIFGGTGLLGGAVVRRLKTQGFENVESPNRREDGVDLLNQENVNSYFK